MALPIFTLILLFLHAAGASTNSSVPKSVGLICKKGKFCNEVCENEHYLEAESTTSWSEMKENGCRYIGPRGYRLTEEFIIPIPISEDKPDYCCKLNQDLVSLTSSHILRTDLKTRVKSMDDIYEHDLFCLIEKLKTKCSSFSATWTMTAVASAGNTRNPLNESRESPLSSTVGVTHQVEETSVYQNGNVTFMGSVTLPRDGSDVDLSCNVMCKGHSAEAKFKFTKLVEYQYVTRLSRGSLPVNMSSLSDPLSILCDVEAKPFPHLFTWTHNGGELAHDVNIEDSGRRLSVDVLRIDHLGKYTCTATNTVYGMNVSKEFTFDVKVKYNSMGNKAQTFTIVCLVVLLVLITFATSTRLYWIRRRRKYNLTETASEKACDLINDFNFGRTTSGRQMPHLSLHTNDYFAAPCVDDKITPIEIDPHARSISGLCGREDHIRGTQAGVTKEMAEEEHFYEDSPEEFDNHSGRIMSGQAMSTQVSSINNLAFNNSPEECDYNFGRTMSGQGMSTQVSSINNPNFNVKPNGTEACTNNITGHCVWGDHLRYTQGEAIGGVDQEEHLYMNEVPRVRPTSIPPTLHEEEHLYINQAAAAWQRKSTFKR